MTRPSRTISGWPAVAARRTGLVVGRRLQGVLPAARQAQDEFCREMNISLSLCDKSLRKKHKNKCLRKNPTLGKESVNNISIIYLIRFYIRICKLITQSLEM